MASSLEIAVEKKCDAEGQEKNARQGGSEKAEGVLRGETEGGTGENVRVVFQSDKGGGTHVFGNGHPQGDAERDHKEDRHTDD